ncbi:LLM class flavin-dependent oxidoreductase [Sphingobium fuliginis]|nr:LLM class flavin-dependent oxidoreductase [Sphingobium fuliginis]
MKPIEIGAFLPIAQNGFALSSNSNPYPPSFAELRDISRLSEEVGLDYIFSMSKWRGFGGATHYWDASFESFSLMAALAASTERVDLYATINPLLFHPAAFAKMAATIDHASNGRLGINLITGATIDEYAQMGILPENYDQQRYRYATEWIEVVKRLWSEAAVDHYGEFFRLEACVSEPKPLRKPFPKLVCAASSEEGLRFTATHADMSFISSRDIDTIKRRSRQGKALAGELGKSIKTAVPLFLVLGETQADADAYQEFLIEGADVDALRNMGQAQTAQSRKGAQEHGAQRLADSRQIYGGLPVVGPAERIAEVISDLAEDGDVDSFLLLFADFRQGLQMFGDRVMPLLGRSVG